MKNKNGSRQLLEKIDSLESDLVRGLSQIESDVRQLEEDEKATDKLEDNLDSLSWEQVKQIEENIDTETSEGEKTLQELQELLNLEEDSVKTLAQVLDALDSREDSISNSEKELDDMLHKLKEEANSGNLDEELTARCIAEIVEVREEIEKTAELEKEAADLSTRLGDKLGKAHLNFVEVKRDEVNIRKEIRNAEEWANKNDVSQLEKFLEEEEAPNLRKELDQLSGEINEEKEDEEEFMDVMQKLAEEGNLTEHQIDKLIAEHQTWSAVVKHSLTHGTLSAKKFADAIYGFTPMAIAAKAGAEAGKASAENIEKENIMNFLGNLEQKIRDTEGAAEEEAEAAVEESETAQEKLEKAKSG